MTASCFNLSIGYITTKMVVIQPMKWRKFNTEIGDLGSLELNGK